MTITFILLVVSVLSLLCVIGLLANESKFNFEMNHDQPKICVLLDYVFIGILGILYACTLPFGIVLYPYYKVKQLKETLEYNKIQKDIKYHEGICPEGFIYLHPADEHDLELYPIYDVMKEYSPDENVILEGGVYHCYRRKDEKLQIDISDIFGG